MAHPTYIIQADGLIVFSISDMAQRQFYHLYELEDLMNDPNFIDSIDFDDDNNIEIVQLPPDRVDQVSDNEDIDDNVMDDMLPRDVPGKVELHCNFLESNDKSTEPKFDTSFDEKSDNGNTRKRFRPTASKNTLSKDHKTDITNKYDIPINRPSTSTVSDSTAIPSTSKQADYEIKKQDNKRVRQNKPSEHIQKLPNTSQVKNARERNIGLLKEKSVDKKKTSKQIVEEKKCQSQWTQDDPVFSISQPLDEIENEKRNIIENMLKDKSPVDIFETLFDDSVCNYIVKQSVLYATQNNRHNFTFSTDCLKKFIGFLLFTGYHSLPQEQLYWSEDEDMGISCVRQCFARNRYLEIKRNIHLNDNSEISKVENITKSYKVQPLFDMLNENYVKYGVFSKNLSIDEQMVRYYGHHYLKQFIRGKPIRFGFKQWLICCGQTGYCFNVDLYEGKKPTNPANEVTSVGLSVVMQKVSVAKTPQNHVFYFDNFFTSFSLMKDLTERKICATGTVRINRMNYCPIKTDKQMMKDERGTYDWRFDKKSKIFAISWKDNNVVKVLSNNESLEPKQSVSRWSKAGKEKVKVYQPYCIAAYNKWMGGVDRMDWSINKYRIKIRGKKWYFPIFTNLIDMTVVNAHVLYTLAGNKIPLLDFRRIIARTYLSITSLSNPKNLGRPAMPKLNAKRVLATVRFDPVGHYIERTPEGKQRKCGICKTNVRKQCSKCNVGLHVECFADWHKKI